jgi:pyruvate kinase
VAATGQPAVARRLALTWGVHPLLADLDGTLEVLIGRFGQTLLERGVVAPGSSIVLVSMTPSLAPGPSNFLKLQAV